MYMSHIMRKPVYAICKQQRCRSACATMQPDQRFCCSLPRYYNISSFYIRNFKPPSSFCSCAGQFVSYLVSNPEDRFSRDEAHMAAIGTNGRLGYQKKVSECNHCLCLLKQYMSRLMTKPTKWHVCPAKIQISLGISPV